MSAVIAVLLVQCAKRELFHRSKFLRETDRKRNGYKGFPNLYYPELYLLSGGYRAFFADHPVSLLTSTTLGTSPLAFVEHSLEVN